MKRRCLNPNCDKFQHYGGRGIKICKRWLDKKNGFINFYKDMGERPEGLTLDRINNEGNYTPHNCRWATQKTQCNNRRNHKPVYKIFDDLTYRKDLTNYQKFAIRKKTQKTSALGLLNFFAGVVVGAIITYFIIHK